MNGILRKLGLKYSLTQFQIAYKIGMYGVYYRRTGKERSDYRTRTINIAKVLNTIVKELFNFSQI